MKSGSMWRGYRVPITGLLTGGAELATPSLATADGEYDVPAGTGFFKRR